MSTPRLYDGQSGTADNPKALTTVYAYDALDRLTSMIEGHGTGLARQTTYAYDVEGNLRQVTTPNQPARVTTEYSYDAHDRLTRTTRAYALQNP
jgi:YD repeat-containing protein